MEKQFGPLQKQSETAKEYLKKREELKHYDINMFLVEMKRLKGQIRENDEKLKIAQDELIEAGKKHEDMKAQYEKIEQEVDEIDAGIEHAKTIFRQSLQTVKGRNPNWKKKKQRSTDILQLHLRDKSRQERS